MIQSLKKFAFVLAVTALAALIAIGCGGGSDAPTKTAYIKEADALCRKSEKAKQDALENYLQKVAPTARSKLSLVEAEKLTTEVIIPALRTQADELRELDVPGEEGAKKGAEGVTASFLQGVEEAESNPSLISNVKTGPFSEAADLAQKYGFKVCILYY